jgi:hypothetical protein
MAWRMYLSALSPRILLMILAAPINLQYGGIVLCIPSHRRDDNTRLFRA